ncbi:MAG TPA: hypothetical protein VGG74_09300 [Kofleriaceae bacterium]|jgi:hypothetical protein
MLRAAVIAIAVLASCTSSSDNLLESCQQDSDCSSGSTCSAIATCEPVRTVHVMWTVAGQPASASTCSTGRDLDVSIENPDDPSNDLEYFPVPCAEGELTLLDMPSRFVDVAIARTDGVAASGPLDGSGDALLDLPQ